MIFLLSWFKSLCTIKCVMCLIDRASSFIKLLSTGKTATTVLNLVEHMFRPYKLTCFLCFPHWALLLNFIIFISYLARNQNHPALDCWCFGALEWNRSRSIESKIKSIHLLNWKFQFFNIVKWIFHDFYFPPSHFCFHFSILQR